VTRGCSWELYRSSGPLWQTRSYKNGVDKDNFLPGGVLFALLADQILEQACYKGKKSRVRGHLSVRGGKNSHIEGQHLESY